MGSIYITTDETDNPITRFGGNWVQLKDVFLLGAGDTYINGATGGEATHTLTIEEMPYHYHWIANHLVSYPVESITTQFYMGGGGNPAGYGSRSTNYAGGSQPHNNMPPYLVVYIWKRLAD